MSGGSLSTEPKQPAYHKEFRPRLTVSPSSHVVRAAELNVQRFLDRTSRPEAGKLPQRVPNDASVSCA
eukprot:CAMPEP_0181502944 /NCGR_PEP_ID=MMETSP1110-20121109/56655_1 /TAXON_ID=174948 /ORGANISM="Symbiodinium sp., Strain CCMP421" /LENGTH=67 /DNA_ID=CAMNT_0023631617 /DNA_START=27 /DNA_END=227 /DNA_ORIENTATION=-